MAYARVDEGILTMRVRASPFKPYYFTLLDAKVLVFSLVYAYTKSLTLIFQ